MNGLPIYHRHAVELRQVTFEFSDNFLEPRFCFLHYFLFHFEFSNSFFAKYVSKLSVACLTRFASKTLDYRWLFINWLTRLSNEFASVSKVHDLITYESKVQVVVSLGSYELLFALGRHEVLINDTWSVLLQSQNVFELGGITMLFKVFSLIKVLLMLCDAYIICQESHNVLTTFILRPWMLVRPQLEPATSRAVTLSGLLFILLLMNQSSFSSRFYSKFHKRRMEELNSTGLHQFISLFLTLSCVADLEDVVRCGDVFVLLYHRQNGLRSLWKHPHLHSLKIDFFNHIWNVNLSSPLGRSADNLLAK